MLAAYTLGKSEDDASGFFPSAGDPNYPQDSLNLRGRVRAFELRRAASLLARLRVGRALDDARDGALGLLLSDWQVSGVVTLQSGRPFTVALLQEIDNSNTGRANLGFGYNDRPNVVGDPALADPTAERWFDTGAFVFPAYGTFGNSGRNTVDGPGYQNVNLALMKRLPLGAPVEAAAAAGGVQPVQPHQLQSAGQLPGVADLRADPVGAEPAEVPAGREGDLLMTLDNNHEGAKARWREVAA